MSCDLGDSESKGPVESESIVTGLSQPGNASPEDTGEPGCSIPAAQDNDGLKNQAAATVPAESGISGWHADGASENQSS